MFLTLLTKEEKYRFLDLIMKIVSVSGEPSEIDLQVVDRLRKEMGEDVNKYKQEHYPVQELIAYFSSKNKSTKNLIFLNLVAASLYDEWYSVEEHFLIEEVQEAFGIDQKKKNELMKLVYAERDLREKTKRAIQEA